MSSETGFLEKIKKNKKLETVLIVALVVVAFGLYLLSTIGGGTTKELSETEAYVLSLESKLSDVLSGQVKGKVEVVISVETGMRTSYQLEKKTETRGDVTTVTESVVLVGGKPLIVTELYPKLSGVLIAVDGRVSISERLKLLSSACSFLGIEEDKIQILEKI